ncbi:MAG: hypothetical protein ACK5TN_11070 [Acidobacteriota bacterium]|jgi:hypothetical protein
MNKITLFLVMYPLIGGSVMAAELKTNSVTAKLCGSWKLIALEGYGETLEPEESIMRISCKDGMVQMQKQSLTRTLTLDGKTRSSMPDMGMAEAALILQDQLIVAAERESAVASQSSIEQWSVQPESGHLVQVRRVYWDRKNGSRGEIVQRRVWERVAACKEVE